MNTPFTPVVKNVGGSAGRHAGNPFLVLRHNAGAPVLRRNFVRGENRAAVTLGNVQS
jgi:hypothetical protein